MRSNIANPTLFGGWFGASNEFCNQDSDRIEHKESIAKSNDQTKAATILIADDEKMILDLAKIVLARAGHTVLTAKNGIEAEELFRAYKDSIDLLILDLCMPQKNGLETLKEVRKIAPNLKVLISTGFAEEQMEKDCAALGILGVLRKPYRPQDLLELIKKLVL